MLIIISHGLCSSGLFGLAGYVYKIFSSRALILCSGIIARIPIMTLCWFLLCSGNISFPPSLSLLSEIFLMRALTGVSLWFIIPMGAIVFVVGVYSLILYRYSQHGSEVESTQGGKLLGFDFIVMSFLLWVPLNLLILCRDLMVGWL